MPPIAVYNESIGNGWNHIVVRYSNRIPSIFLNGTFLHNGIQSPRMMVYAPTQVGGGGYGNFTGSVDEILVYNRPLSGAEIGLLWDSYQ